MPEESIKILYIAGFGRSGSTIFGDILGEVDGLFHAGELYYVWERNLIENRLCGCGTPFGGCGLWRGVFERAFGCLDRVDARQMAGLLDRATSLTKAPKLVRGAVPHELAERLWRLYFAIKAETGTQVIVDSSKRPLYGRLLSSLPGVEVYTVHLVRDPRATAYSWMRKMLQPDKGDGAYMLRFGPLASSARWTVWNAMAEGVLREPDRYLQLRYEDFVARPEPAVREAIRLAGENAAGLPFVSQSGVELEAGHTVSGNPNRFETGVVELRPDDEWISKMRPPDRRLVEALTLPLLRRYGYPIFA